MGNKPSSPNELAEQVNRSNARIKNDFDNSINTTARVIDRTNKIIDDGFNREISQPITAGFNKEIAQPITAGFNKEIAQPFNKTFSKANMEKFDDGLVTVMKDSGRILNKVGEVGDRVLNSPITQIASSIPIVGEVIGGLRLVNTGLKVGGAITSGVGSIADRKAYEGKNDKQIVGNLLERTVKTGEDVAGSGITFH